MKGRRRKITSYLLLPILKVTYSAIFNQKHRIIYSFIFILAKLIQNPSIPIKMAALKQSLKIVRRNTLASILNKTECERIKIKYKLNFNF
jgi:hypothetical protein